MGNVEERLARIQAMHKNAENYIEGQIYIFKDALKKRKEKGEKFDAQQVENLFNNIVWIELEGFMAETACITGLRTQVLNGYFDILEKSERFERNRRNNKQFRPVKLSYDALEAAQKEQS